MIIRPFQSEDEDGVIALWRECVLVRPAGEEEARRRIQAKFQTDAELFLVGVLDDRIIASAIADYVEGQPGWLRYVAVAPHYQRRGFARLIVHRAEELLRERGCGSVSLVVSAGRRGSVECYHRLGYADAKLTMEKKL
jgi:ribosomal protein S18 acetylase RimI-like enzyme